MKELDSYTPYDMLSFMEEGSLKIIRVLNTNARMLDKDRAEGHYRWAESVLKRKANALAEELMTGPACATEAVRTAAGSSNRPVRFPRQYLGIAGGWWMRREWGLKVNDVLYITLTWPHQFSSERLRSGIAPEEHDEDGYAGFYEKICLGKPAVGWVLEETRNRPRDDEAFITMAHRGPLETG